MQYELVDGIAILHFDDGKANAVGHDFIKSINDGLDRAEKEASGLVILGMDGKFSAGFDLAEFKKGPSETAALLDSGALMLLRLFTHTQPIVAACSGHAIAAGALLLLASDTRIGSAGDFKIGLNESAIGMSLPVFGMELAKCRLSARHRTAAVVQSRLYSPDEAVDAGYLDLVVESGELKNICLETAKQLAKIPQEAYGNNKLALRAEYIDRIRNSFKGSPS